MTAPNRECDGGYACAASVHIHGCLRPSVEQDRLEQFGSWTRDQEAEALRRVLVAASGPEAGNPDYASAAWGASTALIEMKRLLSVSGAPVVGRCPAHTTRQDRDGRPGHVYCSEPPGHDGLHRGVFSGDVWRWESDGR